MRKILLVIMTITLMGCSSDDNSNDFNVEVPYSLIDKGELSAGGSDNINKSNLVIKDSKTWASLLVQMNNTNKPFNRFKEIKIDFKKYQVIAVFDQVYPTGGYSIDIISIKEEEGVIYVRIDNLLKGGDNLIMTQPFHLVKIPKTKMEIRFIQIPSDLE